MGANKQPNIVIFPSTTINELYLAGLISMRTRNILGKNRVMDYGAIAIYLDPENRYKRLPGFGPKLIQDITHLRDLYTLQQQRNLEQLATQVYHEYCANTTANGIARLKRLYPTGDKLYLDLMQHTETIVKQLDGCTQPERVAIVPLITQFFSRLIATAKGTEGIQDKEVNTLCHQYKLLTQALTAATPTPKKQYALNPKLKAIVQSAYEEIAKRTLTKTLLKKIQAKYPTYEQIMPLLNQPERSLITHLGQSPACQGTKALSTFMETLRKMLTQVADGKHIVPLTDWRSYETGDIPATDKKWIQTYYTTHQHWPLFYLLINYFRNSTAQQDLLYAYRYGLTDGKAHTFREIGKQFGMSAQNASQIGQPDKLQFYNTQIGTSLEWKFTYQSLYELGFLHKQSNAFLQLCEEEHLSITFAQFARLAPLITPYCSYPIKGEECILIHPEMVTPTEVESYIQEADHWLTNPKKARVTIEQMVKPVPKKKRAIAAAITTYYLKFKGKSITDSTVSLLSKQDELKHQIQQILADHGKPMKPSEIAARVTLEHVSLSSIRTMLSTEKEFVLLMNRGTYGLSRWKHISPLTIRDFVYQLIRKAGHPLHVDEIIQQTQPYYPNTNAHSIYSSILSDTSGRFVQISPRMYDMKRKSRKKKQ
ncbi:MAG: hypothetical protein ACI3ZY_14150 [Parabacteroides sp.]